MNSKNLIANLGGKDNIESISHCMTRIRIKVKNPQSVNRRQIASEKNVIKEQFVGHEYQIIVSNNVEKEFASLQKQMHSGGNDFTAIEWKTIPSQILVPILPLYTTAAIFQGVLVLIKLCNLVSADNYQFLLNLIRLPVFCLPIIIGYSTAKSIKLNPLAGIGFGIELMAVHHYFKAFPNYVGSFIPVILVCLASKIIFVFLDKKIRGIIGATYNFTLGFIITSVIGILFLAPIGLFLGKLFSDTIKLIMLKVPVIAALVSSILYLFLVVKGQHWWLTLLALNNLGALGYSWLFAFTSTAQFGQLGAVLGIATKHKEIKNKKVKDTVKNCLFCIIEPALYGYTTLKKSRYISSLVGLALSAIYLAIANAKMYAFPSSIFSLVNPEQPTWDSLITGLISILIAIFASFIAALVSEQNNSLPKIKVTAPIAGTYFDIAQSKDQTFASKVLGDGIAITPLSSTNADIYAPVNGKIIMIAPDQHAFGMKTTAGVELLVHVGIDTVKLKKAAVKLNLKVGQLVARGDKVGNVNINNIIQAGYNPETLLIVLKNPEYYFDKNNLYLIKRKNETR
ncbi:glucose PTS transporter subunit IIA [Lactobacillus melliventris]|uniref:PTS Glc IIABC n=1 Tax=Lactobacillus melliventris TaxID=1218507 RepID=A0ABX5N2X8_9LACO|nr:glucose PTS transporter subunit IIA [Lactobacillus melliventris]PXY85124.1 hypothetical protein DK873_08300 [Lactobacillus melliventris]